MNRIVSKIVHELRVLLPLTVYFLVANEMIALTKYIVLLDRSHDAASFIRAVVIALVVAKVVLVVDMLPFMRIFKGRPAIWNATWSTCIYTICAVVLQAAEGVIRPWIATGSLSGAVDLFAAETKWSYFWMIQAWLFILLLNYCLVREMSYALGKRTAFEFFLNRPDRS